MQAKCQRKKVKEMKQFLHVLEGCDWDFRKLIRVMCVTKVVSVTMMLWQYGESKVTTV